MLIVRRRILPLILNWGKWTIILVGLSYLLAQLSADLMHKDPTPVTLSYLLIFISGLNLRYLIPNTKVAKKRVIAVKTFVGTPGMLRAAIVAYQTNLVRFIVIPFWLLIGLLSIVAPDIPKTPKPALQTLEGFLLVAAIYVGELGFLTINRLEYMHNKRILE